MVGTSLVLMAIAILFLRNQIRPILHLADGGGGFRQGPRRRTNFRPRGAREVRQAAAAFIEMRERIERAIEQRTDDADRRSATTCAPSSPASSCRSR